MQIIAVKLENAKSYDNATIEFAPGVNAIVGQNGAGKSTILEAIGLAVFDELRYTQSEFVRAGMRTATITVTLESDRDGRLYDVVRRVGGTNAHYVHDPETGIRICEGKADVLSFLHDHMGVESTTDLSALFRDAVGVGQGTFTAVFLNTAANRKTIFDRLLQVEDYNKAVESLRAPARLLRDRRHELEVSIAALQARLEELPKLEQDVTAREVELREAASQANRTREGLEAAVVTREALEKIRLEVSELRAQHGRALERQQSLARELASARQDRADAEGAHALVEENLAGHNRYEVALAHQKELEARVRERQRLEHSLSQDEKAEAVAKTRQAQLLQDLSTVEEAASTVEQLTEAVTRQSEIEAQILEAQQDVTRLQNLEQQITQMRTQVAELSARVEQSQLASKRRSELEQRVDKLRADEEEARKKIDGMRDILAHMKSEADALKEQTESLANVETAVCPVCEQPLTDDHRRELLQRNEARLAGLRENYRDIQTDAKSAEGESAAIRRTIQQVERDLRDLPSAGEADRLDNDRNNAQSGLEALLTQQGNLSGAADILDKLKAQLAELGNPRNAYLLAQSQVERKAPIMAEMAEINAKLDAIQGRLNAVSDQLARFEGLDEDLDACGAEIRANHEAYQIVLKNGHLASMLAERTEKVERLVVAAAEGSQELDVLMQRLEKASARFDEDAYRQALVQEQTLRSSLGALNERIGMMRAQQEETRRAIIELHAKEEALVESQRRHAAAGEQEDVLETVRTLLRRAGPYVTQVLIRQVSDNARQIFSDIMQDYSRHLAWNDDYGITLEVGGYDRDFAQLSGGEQMSAALAVRLALVRELSDIDIAFFDEPTANLDEGRRESLARQILEVKGFRQLFVISHDDTFEQATQNLIRVERTDGVSTITTG